MAKDINVLALVSVLSTLLIPLVVPLIIVFAKKDDKEAVFFSKQVIVLSIASLIGVIISMVLIIVLIGIILLPLVGLATLVMYIILLINVIKGETKPLPIIGNIWK
jgi:uncharacterized protein